MSPEPLPGTLTLAYLLRDLEALDHGTDHCRLLTVLRVLRSSEAGRRALEELQHLASLARLTHRPWREVAAAAEANQQLSRLLRARCLEQELDRFDFSGLGPRSTVYLLRIVQQRLERGLSPRHKLQRILDQLLSQQGRAKMAASGLLLLPRPWHSSTQPGSGKPGAGPENPVHNPESGSKRKTDGEPGGG